MIVELYHRAGHQAKRTGATGDHGVDVVVEAKNGEKWVVQCKRWKGSVGEPVVRDFYGVVQHEKADKGILFTTGRYSTPAQQWAKGKPIALYDGNKLAELWSRSKLQPDQTSQVVVSQ
jgi:restriction system protein